MRIFQALLEGAALEDAFIYGTNLYCWTFDRKLRIYRTTDIERALEAADPDHGAAISYALFHSRGVGASAVAVDGWRGAWARAAEEATPALIDGELLPYRTLDVDTDSPDLLDMMIFYRRIYLATADALFSAQPFDPDQPPQQLRMRARVDGPCYALSGGLGAVAASCADRGLYLLLDDKEWSGDRRRARKAASHSLRSEIGFASVVNHRSRGEVEFLAAQTADTHDGRVLTSVRRAKEPKSNTRQSGAEDVASKAELALWDQARLVIFRDGRMASVSVIREGDVRRLNRVRDLGIYSSARAVLAAVRVGRSFALETEDSIIFAGEDPPKPIPTGPVISLRAYPRSIRYRRLITATSERGLWLIGLAERPYSDSDG